MEKKKKISESLNLRLGPIYFSQSDVLSTFIGDGKRREGNGLLRQGVSPSHLFISILLKIHFSSQ